MAGEYQAKPQSTDAIVAAIKRLRRDLDQLRAAARVRNSAVSGGNGITVGDPNGSTIRVWVQQAQGSSGLYPRIDFQSQDTSANPASVYLTDGAADPSGTGIDSNFKLRSVSNGARNASLLLMVPGSITLYPDESQFVRGLTLSSSAPASLSGWTFDTNTGGTGGAFWNTPSGTEWRAQNGSAAYIPVRASSFPTSSSEAVKERVTDVEVDPIATVCDAPARSWQYKPAQADEDGRRHIGPMAELLPDALVRIDDDGVKTTDLRDLVGVLWGAIGQQQQQIEQLTKKLDSLDGKAGS